ncbi:FAD:protein FMN transferase [Marinihelvus fidelis]|nr:FAD:protein FMN transferase [Marinihelvus fidelis]
MRLQVLLLLLATLLLAGCEEPPGEELRFVGQTMGTSWSVIAHSPRHGVDPKAVSESIAALLADLDSRLSNWIDNSEVSRFNRAQPSTWVPVSDDTLAVVLAAMDVSAQSGGSFDITLGPLIDTWGFGPGGRREEPPPDNLVSGAGSLAGMTRLSFREEPPALMKSVRGLGLDLGGIAKGYAVDQVAELLSAYGFRGFLVEIGGEVRAVGSRTAGGPWRVALETPPGTPAGVGPVIPLQGHSVATSGTYRNFFETDGQAYSHILDPWHKHPVTHEMAAASVIADEAMLADAWATTMMVQGPERARELALGLDLAVHLQYREANAGPWRSWSSPAWLALVPSADGEPGQ